MDSLTLMIAGAVFLAYVAGAMGPRWSAPSRKGWRGKALRSIEKRAVVKPATVSDSTDQLRTVMASSFEKRRLMSRDEARVFLQVEKAVKALDLPWRVMAQVSLGEAIRSADSRAHATINSKRVDILVITSGGEPIAAIEYQGSGHYLGTAAARDAVKKEALRRAGVSFVEITPAHEADDVKREIERLAARHGRRTATVQAAAYA